MQNFQDYLAHCQARNRNTLEHVLPASNVIPQRLHQAMRYAVLNNGKRIRPALVFVSGELLGISNDILNILAAAIEIIHSYSLVHDDLPAIDNDDWRRGLATCHREFDEATAILVGDALQNLAFEIIAEFTHPALSAKQQLAMIAALAKACDSSGMVGGQAIDITIRPDELTPAKLEDMHRRKTGALLLACIQLPLLALDNPGALQPLLLEYGAELGLAFQIRDDIIDIESSTETLGKTQGTDLTNGKLTYVTVFGIEKAKAKLAESKLKIDALLLKLGPEAQRLRQLTEYIVARDY